MVFGTSSVGSSSNPAPNSQEGNSDATLAPTPMGGPAPYNPIQRNELNRVVSGSGSSSVGGATGSSGIRTQITPLSPDYRAEGGNPESQGMQHLATLNVGDRFASQNSRETALAAGPHLRDRASYSVSVPSPSVCPTPVDSSPEPQAHSGGNEDSSRSYYWTDSEEEDSLYLLRRRRHLITDPIHPGAFPAAVTPQLEPVSGSGSSGGEGATSRYVLDVHDVHDLGGRPSSIQIQNASGETVQSVNLPPGDSRVTVDLPPGQYTFTAVSGTRPEGAPNAGGDNLDNFRVDVFQAGGMEGGGASLGGGDMGGGGNSGATP
ncbi:MAG: hypothetical protein U1F57_11205 [bacterium]